MFTLSVMILGYGYGLLACVFLFSPIQREWLAATQGRYGRLRVLVSRWHGLLSWLLWPLTIWAYIALFIMALQARKNNRL
jgi:hypothetical protein